MNEETKALVDAIISLKQESSYFKDYIYPLAAGFFSTLLGAGVAYFTIRHQDYAAIQKDRVQAINDWVLTTERAVQSLISIKKNYQEHLTSDPFQRALVIGSLIGSVKRIDKDITSLSFIAPRKHETYIHNIKWRLLPQISSMIDNYNLLVDAWNKREEIEKPIKEKLKQDHGRVAFTYNDKKIVYSSVSEADFLLLINLTERTIKLTDEIIIEFVDFLENFPKTVRSLISRKYQKRYGPIIAFGLGGNKLLEKVIAKSTVVDYNILATLFDVPEEFLKKEYDSGYK